MRTYDRTASVVFLKTNEQFGGLSNMAGGFPLRVNGIRIFTAEALYQACRFPHRPEIQRLIIGQASPMTAKMKSKPHRRDSRPDWNRVRIKIMRWCLRMKLAQNWEKFSALLLATGDRPIVEESRKDDFWGAKRSDDQTLVGMNILGRLLVELREKIRIGERDSFLRVEPLAIPDFRLDGKPIQPVFADEWIEDRYRVMATSQPGVVARRTSQVVAQASLFDQRLLSQALQLGSSGQLPGGGLARGLIAYPKYKDSGVRWLGDVPEHWEVLPALAIYKPKLVRNTGMIERTVLSLSYGRIIVKPQDRLHGLVPESFDAYQIVDPGNIIVRATDLQNDHTSLRVGYSRKRGIITAAYMCLDTTGRVSSEFGYHFLNTYDLLKIIYGFGSGLRQNLDFSHIKRMPVLVPDLPEQGAIVRFLDYADQRTREYIRAKQKLIKLLGEQKQAIIHRTVSRGLDPNVRLKPSGVKWLGGVPEHWEVAALRHRYSQCLGKMLDSKRITGNHSLPYLRNTDVQWDLVNVQGLPTMDIPPAEYGRYTVEKGDLLVCEGGEVGRCAIWRGQVGVCGFQKALHRLRPLNTRRDVPRFIYYVLRAAAKSNAFNDGHVSTIAHLTGDKLRAHRFPFPPVTEQELLVSFLDSELEKVDQAVSTALREIALLREYRIRLIADVVTGKLDVREAAGSLPLEAEEEPEPLDEADTMIDADQEPADDLDVASEEAGA